MPATGLSTLSVEILHEVCSLLHDSHKPSLAAFSRVDRRCCGVATPWLFRRITIHVQGSHSLRRNLDALLPALERREAFSTLRRITISGTFTIYDDDQTEPPEAECELDDDNCSGEDEIYGAKDHDLVWTPGEVPTAEEMAPYWSPLISVLQNTPQLHYLDYNLETGVPCNIVSALEQYCPSCCLHVEHFRYWDLTSDTRVPNEIALVKSPNFHSLRTRYIYRFSRGVDDYNAAAALRTIGGISPNLKHVTMLDCRTPDGDGLWCPHFSIKPRWEGFDPSLGPVRRASLESFATDARLGEAQLEKFTRVIEFARLRHLAFYSEITAGAMRYLIHDINFPRLQSLTLNPMFAMCESPSTMLVNFLTSIPPLESLKLQGFVTQDIVDTTIAHHGSRLRSLKLELGSEAIQPSFGGDLMCLTPEDCERLRDSVPHLEDLQVPIWRCRSAGDEVSCYRILSQFRNLRTLFIEMRCDRPDTPECRPLPASLNHIDRRYYGEDQERQETRFWRTHDLVINAAVDESLACSIFTLISGAKKGPPLASLKLYPVCIGAVENHIVSDFISHVRRAYLVEPSLRDDSDAPRVRELGERARNARFVSSQKSRGHRYGRQRAIAGKLLRWIWPERQEGSEGWWDDWQSFPLQLDETEAGTMI